MTIGKLHLVEIERSLIRPNQSLVLRDNLFLIVKLLLRNGLALPGLLVAIQIHSGLRQQVGVAFKRTLSRLNLRRILARINFDQRIALLDRLTFPVMHLCNDTSHLVINRGGIHRGDGANRIPIDTDIPLFSGGNSQGHCTTKTAATTAAGSRGFGGVVMVSQNDHKDDRKHHQQQNPKPLAPLAGRFRSVTGRGAR